MTWRLVSKELILGLWIHWLYGKECLLKEHVDQTSKDKRTAVNQVKTVSKQWAKHPVLFFKLTPLTQWLLQLFAKNVFSDILVVLRQNFDRFWTRRSPTTLGFSIFDFFFSFLLLLFFLLLQWLNFYWLGLLAVKKLLRKRHQGKHFYHGAARCTSRKFCSAFFTQLFEHFLCISQAPLGWPLWSGHEMEKSFPPAASIDYAHFGPTWWHQKWKKG